MKKLIFVILICMLLSSCAQRRETVRTYALDTEICITGNKSDYKYLRKASSMCGEYEKIFSRTDKGSELYKLNSGETTSPCDDIKDILSFTKRVYEASGGAFDCTLAPLSDLWNVKERKVPPKDEEVAALLKKTGYSSVTAEPFSLGGRTLDFGAAAKGYIADRICEYLRENDISDCIADLGGNVYVLGEFTVGIRNPEKPDRIICKMTLKDKSAVTSGAYQRYFEYGGKRYHHILNPKTGFCAESGVSSVTVVSPSSLTADCLSTAIFVMGEKGLSLCSEFEDTDAIIITESGKIVTTDGFSEKYKLECVKN